MPVSNLESVTDAIRHRKGIGDAIASAMLVEIEKLRTAPGATDESVLTTILTTYGGSLSLLDNNHALFNMQLSLGNLLDLLQTTFRLGKCKA